MIAFGFLALLNQQTVDVFIVSITTNNYFTRTTRKNKVIISDVLIVILYYVSIKGKAIWFSNLYQRIAFLIMLNKRGMRYLWSRSFSSFSLIELKCWLFDWVWLRIYVSVFDLWFSLQCGCDGWGHCKWADGRVYRT